MACEGAYELLSSNRGGFSQLLRAVVTEESALQFFVSCKLINLQKSFCPDCKAPSFKYKHANSKLGFKWVCLNQKCGIKYSPIKGTFFERMHITFLQAFDLMLHWFFRQKIRLTMADCDVAEHTSCDWTNFCREVCFTHESKRTEKLGGSGIFVEVDETHLFRRKNHQGHRIAGEDVWIVGGICRDTKDRFAVRIKRRNKRTLWKVIKKYVARESILVTDGAAVYTGIAEKLGFLAHEVVIHKENFRHPLFREIFTNNVECMWGKLKQIVKNGGSDESVDMYIAEYIYRSRLMNQYGPYNYYPQLRQYLKDMRKIYPASPQT